MRIKFLLLSISLLIISDLAAQDKHFSLFNMSPLTLNPANTGAFEGTVRLSGIYRGQWYGLSSSNGFQTPAFSGDSPILAIGKKKRDWLGVGATIIQDNAGLFISDNQFALSAAYHKSLDKKGRTIVTFGVQGGRYARKLNNKTDFIFGDQIANGTRESDDLENLLMSGGGGAGGGGGNEADAENGSIDISAGVKLLTKVGKKADLTLGLAFDHILGAEYNLLSLTGSTPNPDPDPTGNNGPKLRRPLLTTIHGQFNTPLSDKLSLHPTILAQAVEGSPLELALQAVAAYEINSEKKVSLRGGLGYRVSDAGEFLFGLDYGDIRVMASYDLTLSELSNATTGGAFEIGAWYIIKIFKKPTVNPAVLCPQL
ncbi:MAG: PorP/SprF family type IX secretion system membrane protein [Saprospiraceae bacterium]